MSTFGTIPLEYKLWCKCKLNGDWSIKFGVGDYEDATTSVWENKTSALNVYSSAMNCKLWVQVPVYSW